MVKTTMTAIPKPNAAFTCFEIAKNVTCLKTVTVLYFQ